MSIYEEKKRLREEIESYIKNLSKEEITKESEEICKILEEKIPKEVTVCAYNALPDEINIDPLISNLIEKENSVYLPCYKKELVFRKVTKNTKMNNGSFGILEPDLNSPILNPKDINVVLVPGRTFDKYGNRLGRGKGIYDSWIQTQRKINKSTQFWGIAFKCQIIDKVPTQEHDQKMDEVITIK